MALYDVLLKIQSAIPAPTGFPAMQLGIIDEALQGPFPAWYLDVEDEAFESEFLQSVASTESTATVQLYLTANQRNVPVGDTLLKYLLDLGKATKAQIEAKIENGTFKADGARGSDIRVVAMRYHFRPKDPVGAVKLTLLVTAYL